MLDLHPGADEFGFMKLTLSSVARDFGGEIGRFFTCFGDQCLERSNVVRKMIWIEVHAK